MIRMQKKPAPVVSEKVAEDETAANGNSPVNVAGEPKEEEGAGGLSLLGIGGKQIKSGAKKAGKKRTPGEIRIQKGKKETLLTSLNSPPLVLPIGT